ncbi:MAG: hypothetical protein OXU86_00290 [Thaumarchaeota archaeon]|nr:hypothetical protein [Nitrososphaerota archaeon]MDD9813265.1 hypothetical protein [Nitrososphaerota archaeon]MDD9825212.1 hypothetical protein [Nitrososphaerota archaeon]MDD9842857.1 hypothetical protein [Nitrososphaerota archaeon]
MTKDVRVSVTLAGRHSMKPTDVRGACGAAEKILLDGTTEYTVQSFVPGDELTRHGGRGGSGLVSVRLDGSSFMVIWDDVSSFEAPASMLDVVGRCLQAAGEMHVRVNSIVEDISMDPIRIGDGSLEARFATTMFELGQPAPPGENGDGGEIAFRAMASRAENSTVSLAIFGERKSSASAVPEILRRALGALAGYCEVSGR